MSLYGQAAQGIKSLFAFFSSESDSKFAGILFWRKLPIHVKPGAGNKSFLVLFFKKEQKNLLFLKKKKQKDFYSLRSWTSSVKRPGDYPYYKS